VTAVIDTVIRLLFIGNSLTAANDLPATVASLGRAAGVRIECTAVVRPGFSLEDHWHDGEAQKTIARGGWTFVVLQQGPSALPESRVLLEEYVRRFDTLIRAAGAKTAVYMVWPSAERRGDFDGVSRSYAGAAARVGGLLFPVGDAWREAWQRDPDLRLYGPDGFHPSPLATSLGALVILQGITGRPAPAAALAAIDGRARAVLAAASEAVYHSDRRRRPVSGIPRPGSVPGSRRGRAAGRPTAVFR
jgi:hypothetical protein